MLAMLLACVAMADPSPEPPKKDARTLLIERLGKGPRAALAKKTPEDAVAFLFKEFLGRAPTRAEIGSTTAHFGRAGRKEACDDLVWALLNSKEFATRNGIQLGDLTAFSDAVMKECAKRK